MLAAVARPGLALRTGSFQTARVQRRSLVCRASAEEPRQWHEKLALPAAALLGAALLFAATPDEAEAARSGGRVGGSSGFSSRRAAPAPRCGRFCREVWGRVPAPPRITLCSYSCRRSAVRQALKSVHCRTSRCQRQSRSSRLRLACLHTARLAPTGPPPRPASLPSVTFLAAAPLRHV